MPDFFKKNYFPFIFLFAFVFISRLPFLSAGYGIEEDSWAIALAAFHTKLMGVYEPSRLPGHPFQELIYSALWGSGCYVFNALCALFSAIGVLFFALILKNLQFKQYLLAAITFAFVPVYFISSTYTIDFVWTQALILIAFYCLLKNRLLWCGIFLGLAIGCRITSGVMLLPFMIIYWQSNFKTNLVNLLKMVIPMGVVAVLLFLPVILIFGSNFFMYYDQFPYPPFPKVMYKITIGVFGLIGTLSLFFFSIWFFINRKKWQRGEGFNYPLDKKIIITCYVIISLYIISYFRLPQKSGYMIPTIPFIILLFGYYLNKKSFTYLCLSLFISSFLFSINLTDAFRGSTHSKYAAVFTVAKQEIFLDPFSGPIFSDYSKRKQKIQFTEQVIEKVNAMPARAVVIAGWWFNEILVTSIDRPANRLVIYESYIDEAKLKDYQEKKYEIFYLPEQNVYNDLMFKINVTDQFAKPFIE
ncbi:MAG TPA: hypothetical protein VFF27_03970 [Bacteroidia bacterium]|jgi:hypothetical protein|nr:hypothetical protein [Bacteroidia bacterium]